MTESKSLVVKCKRILVKILEVALMVSMAVLVIDVLIGVGTRYIIGSQASWSEELARVLLIWVSLLGGAVAYGERAHLGVNYLVEKMDIPAQKAMKIAVDLAVIGFAITVLVMGGWGLTAETFRLDQQMMALGIAKGYVYLAVPISGIYFIIFAIESIFETLSGAKPNESEDEIPAEEIQAYE